MTRLTTAEQSDLFDLESIILNDADFASLMEDEKQVEDIMERSYLVETMEAAILAHDRRQAEAETRKPNEPRTGRLLKGFRAKCQQKAVARNAGKKRKPAKRKVATKTAKTAKVAKIVDYSSDYVLNTDKLLGAFRKGENGVPSQQPIGIESYRSENGSEPELFNRKMYSTWQLQAILNLPDDRRERLKELVNAR